MATLLAKQQSVNGVLLATTLPYPLAPHAHPTKGHKKRGGGGVRGAGTLSVRHCTASKVATLVAPLDASFGGIPSMLPDTTFEMSSSLLDLPSKEAPKGLQRCQSAGQSTYSGEQLCLRQLHNDLCSTHVSSCIILLFPMFLTQLTASPGNAPKKIHCSSHGSCLSQLCTVSVFISGHCLSSLLATPPSRSRHAGTVSRLELHLVQRCTLSMAPFGNGTSITPT